MISVSVGCLVLWLSSARRRLVIVCFLLIALYLDCLRWDRLSVQHLQCSHDGCELDSHSGKCLFLLCLGLLTLVLSFVLSLSRLAHLSCLLVVLSCECLVLSLVMVLSCLVLACLVLSCLVLSWLVLSCLVLYCLATFCFDLSCLLS